MLIMAIHLSTESRSTSGPRTYHTVLTVKYKDFRILTRVIDTLWKFFLLLRYHVHLLFVYECIVSFFCYAFLTLVNWFRSVICLHSSVSVASWTPGRLSPRTNGASSTPHFLPFLPHAGSGVVRLRPRCVSWPGARRRRTRPVCSLFC